MTKLLVGVAVLVVLAVTAAGCATCDPDTGVCAGAADKTPDLCPAETQPTTFIACGIESQRVPGQPCYRCYLAEEFGGHIVLNQPGDRACIYHARPIIDDNLASGIIVCAEVCTADPYDLHGC
jgi:hypothetical protein